MANLITYDDKDKTQPEGSAKRTWRDVDANEVKQVVNENANGAMRIIGDWNMSTNLLPASTKKGYAYRGINGPTTTLLDASGNVIPNGVLIVSMADGASTTSVANWFLTYPIN